MDGGFFSGSAAVAAGDVIEMHSNNLSNLSAKIV